MSYTINHYNGNAIATVVDGTINNTLDITLIGKNYAGYGQSQNENFVYMLENFANATQPPLPIAGQIWYDTTSNKLRFYDGIRFRVAGSAEAAASIAPPGNVATGDFWWDTTNQQLNVYNGTAYVHIGPFTTSTNSGTTQFQINQASASPSGSYPIIQAVLNGTNTVFTVSSIAFSLNTNVTSGQISGFTTNGIFQGITLNSLNYNNTNGVYSSSNYKLWGTATNADALGGLPASNYIQSGNANFTSAVTFVGAGLTVASLLNLSTSQFSFNGGTTQTTPIISSIVANVPLVFQTKTGSTPITTLQLLGNTIYPGATGTTTLGTNTAYYNNFYSVGSTLLPIGQAPTNPIAGQMAVCDGIGWNPVADSKQHLMIYLNAAWTVAA
jgi:hypothetical protein